MPKSLQTTPDEVRIIVQEKDGPALWAQMRRRNRLHAQKPIDRRFRQAAAGGDLPCEAALRSLRAKVWNDPLDMDDRAGPRERRPEMNPQNRPAEHLGRFVRNRGETACPPAGMVVPQ